MKTFNSQSSLYAILTIGIASAFMLGSIPYAFAMPDANMSCDPAVAGGVTDCRVLVGGATGVLPIRSDPTTGVISVYNIPKASLTDDDVCPNDTTLAAGQSQWILVRDGGGVANDGKPIGYMLPAPTATCTANCGIFFKFPGDVVGSTKTKIMATETATLNVRGGTESGLTTVDAEWIQNSGPGPADPATAVATASPPVVLNNLASCGDESVAAPFDTTWELYQNWAVVEPVGGTIIPINTVSLLVSGLALSSIWIVPLGIGIAGAALVAYRLKQ